MAYGIIPRGETMSALPPQDPLSYWVTQMQQGFRDFTKDLETLRGDVHAGEKFEIEIKSDYKELRTKMDALKFQQSIIIGLLLILVVGVVFNTVLVFALRTP